MPRRCRMTLPSLYPAGGGRGGWGCRPTLPLVFFFAPYPPSPLPRRGRGSPKDYFAGGFAPGTPALNRLRHLQTVPNRCPETEPGRHRSRGGVSRTSGGLAPALPDNLAIAVPSGGRGGWGCRPALPLVCFAAPYPPSPLPRWGRGSPKDYFAGGFAPGTPALNRLRHRLNLPRRYPADGLPSLSPPYPTFSLLCCPPFPEGEGYPPDPRSQSALPRWGRGRFKVISCKGLRPLHPRA